MRDIQKIKVCYVLKFLFRTKPELIKKTPDKLAREVFSQFCKLGFCKKDQFEKGFTRVFPCINPIIILVMKMN